MPGTNENPLRENGLSKSPGQPGREGDNMKDQMQFITLLHQKLRESVLFYAEKAERIQGVAENEIWICAC